MQINILVQTEPFDTDALQRPLLADVSVGALVSFVGQVRDMNLGDAVQGLSIEHYPGMTEASLTGIAEQAAERWSLNAVTIVHRVGDLDVGEPIVLVIAASAHRADAFSACEFIMDYLKTEAPFWKKERAGEACRWLDARHSDEQRAKRWR